MVDLKTFNADGIDEGHWRSELLSAFSRSDRKSEHSFDAQDTERLVEVLIKAIPQIMTFGMLFPDVDEIKPLKKHLESLILAADAICRAMPNHPILYDSAMWASSELQANKFRGYHMDFEMIHDYARRVWLYLDDAHQSAKTPNKNNMPALKICQTVCIAFQRCLHAEPTCRNADFKRQSDDFMDCTYYERICHIISALTGFPISWSTIRQAKMTYMDTGSDLKSSQSERLSIFNKLPFERHYACD